MTPVMGIEENDQSPGTNVCHGERIGFYIEKSQKVLWW